MKLMKQIFHFRGIKIGKKDKTILRVIIIVLSLPFLAFFGCLTYFLFSQLASNLYLLLAYILFVCFVSTIGTLFFIV